jgi:hypothetical protein
MANMNRVESGWASEEHNPCRTRMSLILAPQTDTGLMSLLWRRLLLPSNRRRLAAPTQNGAHEYT